MAGGGGPDGGADGPAFEFAGEIWHWRGPSPYHFVTVPDEESQDLQAIANAVTYGWGMVPVRVRLGGTTWETSLWPKDGRYLVPIKDAVRSAEGVGEGTVVTLRLTVAPRAPR
jgi:hypothetical protein